MANTEVYQDVEFEESESSRRNLIYIILGIWAVIAIGLIIAYVVVLTGKPSNLEVESEIDAKIRPFVERLNQNPNDVEALMKIGHTYADNNKFPEALGVYQRVLTIQPENTDALVDAGTMMLQMGQNDEGFAQIEKALTINPTYDYALVMKASYLATIKKEYQQALDILRQLEKTIPPGPKLDVIKQDIADIERQMSQAGIKPSP